MAVGAGWAGARALTATSGPGHLADDRVRRPGLLRRDPRRHHRRAADGAEHRPAHPDQPGRHPQAPPARPRRLPAHRPDPRLGRRVLLDDDRGARPGAAVPDPGLRRHRPRPGHEPLADRPVRLPRQAAPPRQAARRRGPRAARPASSGTRTSTATASATGRSPAPSTRWPPTSPGAPATTRSRATASAPRTGRRTSTAWP